jgi:hypothetical protein
MPATILFFAADPRDTSRLELDEEFRAIQDEHDEAKLRDAFDLRAVLAARVDDVRKKLADYRPSVVHFGGHGAGVDAAGPLSRGALGPEESAPATRGRAEILLEDEGGRAVPVPIDALAELFRLDGQPVRCVVLNACNTLAQAQAIAKYVDCAVGTSAPIPDAAALAFSKGFYGKLCDGGSLQEAFLAGKNSVALARAGDPEILVLCTREGARPGDIRLARAAPKIGDREQRTRDAMIQRVRRDWIEGVLDKGPLFSGAPMIVPDLQTDPAALADPWGNVMERPARQGERLPAGSTLTDVFDRGARTLLVLGEPGSGKTTSMLALARALLDRAAEDAREPVPVVVSLANWSGKPLGTWLVEELASKYLLSPSLGKPLIESEALLPLLDGLDEVAEEKRAACVEAINAFRLERSTLPLVVCCRRGDYAAIGHKLRLDECAVVLPLVDAQVDAYLAHAGPELAALREALAADPDLREMARTPLMLGVMAVAYGKGSTAEIPRQGGVEERRRRVLETYVRYALGEDARGQRLDHTRFTPAETRRWLAWLGAAMKRQSESIFVIGRLGPDWLASPPLRWAYAAVDRVGMSSLVTATLIALAFAISFTPSGNTREQWRFIVDGHLGSDVGMMLGIAAAFALLGPSGAPSPAPRSGWRVVGDMALAWLASTAAMMAVGFLVVPRSEWRNVSVASVPMGILLGATLGGAVGRPGFGPRPIALLEVTRWSRERALRITRVVLTVMGSLFLVLAGLALLGHALGRGASWKWLVGSGIPFILKLSFMAIVFVGYFGSFEAGELKEKVAPNQAFRGSLRRALAFGLGGSFLVCAVFITLGLIRRWDPAAILPALGGLLRAGILLGFPASLVFGGYGCLSHVSLRLVLRATGAAPLRYATFLDHCTDRALVRKIGGSYAFMHRLLLEHFAAMEAEAAPSPPAEPARAEPAPGV